jgi:hypothetical protein
MCRKTEDTGIITLSKITQAHKDKYHIFSHMWNSAGKKERGQRIREGTREVNMIKGHYTHYENVITKPITLYHCVH